eukprot:10062932-Ditylum_brightwellii.AAC.1
MGCSDYCNAHHCFNVVQGIGHMAYPFLQESAGQLLHQQLRFATKHSINRNDKGYEVLTIVLTDMQ